MSFDDFRFGKQGLAALRDEHRIVSQHFLEKVWVRTQFG